MRRPEATPTPMSTFNPIVNPMFPNPGQSGTSGGMNKPEGKKSGPPAIISAPAPEPPLPPTPPARKPPPPPPLEPETHKKAHGAILTSLILMVTRSDSVTQELATDRITLQKKSKVEQVMGRMSQDNLAFRDYCFWLHERTLHLSEGKATEYYRLHKGLYPPSAYCVVEYPSRDGIRNISWGLAMANPSFVQVDPCPVMDRGKSLRAKITLRGLGIRDYLGSPYLYNIVTTSETITVMKAQAEGRYRCAHARFVLPLRIGLGQTSTLHPECTWCPHNIPELHMVSPMAKNRKRSSPSIEPSTVQKFADSKAYQEQYNNVKRNRIQFYNLSTVHEEMKRAPVFSLAGVIYPVIPMGVLNGTVQPSQQQEEKTISEQSGSKNK